MRKKVEEFLNRVRESDITVQLVRRTEDEMRERKSFLTHLNFVTSTLSLIFQSFRQTFTNQFDNLILIFETDFFLRRMYVDVDFVWMNRKRQVNERVRSFRE